MLIVDPEAAQETELPTEPGASGRRFYIGGSDNRSSAFTCCCLAFNALTETQSCASVMVLPKSGSAVCCGGEAGQRDAIDVEASFAHRRDCAVWSAGCTRRARGRPQRCQPSQPGPGCWPRDDSRRR